MRGGKHRQAPIGKDHYWDGKRWRRSKAMCLNVTDDELDRRASLSMPRETTPCSIHWPSSIIGAEEWATPDGMR